MKLSDVYGKEKFYKPVGGEYEGACIENQSIVTKKGEFYLRDYVLFFTDAKTSKTIELVEDVQEWTTLDDETVIYQCSDSSYFFVMDYKGEVIKNGIISNEKCLIYHEEKAVVKEDSNGNKTTIFNLASKETIVEFDDKEFWIEENVANTSFTYSKAYNFDGSLNAESSEFHLKADFFRRMTREFTLPMELDEFIKLVEDHDEKKDEEITQFYRSLNEVTFENIDRVIEHCRKSEMHLNEEAIENYNELKEFLLDANTTDLLKAILVALEINQHQRCLRIFRSDFLSPFFIKKLNKLRQKIGNEAFNEIIVDYNSIKKYL